ncbi:UBX domain-containing protein 6 [Aphelenchoides bicaudatus]|nr:UBX domain-containing protein 6 [Aphelenchoides bicaudatus]
MNRLKKFLEKKKVDKKFKGAGQGHSLTGGPAQVGGVSKNTYQQPADSAGRRQTSETVAEAAAKRLQPEQSISAAQRRIREQARKELEEEQRLQEAEQQHGSGDSRRDDRDGLHEFEHTEQISTLLYTCDLFDNNMIHEVEKYLRGMLQEEPIEASIIMIWSLNSQEKIDQAVPILLKYLTNITNSPNEAKYRRIRTTNKTFLEKIASIKGGIEFIKAVGFLEDDQRTENGSIETFLALPEPEEATLAILDAASQSLENGAPISLKLYRDPKIYRIDPSKPIPRPEIPADFFSLSSGELRKEQQQRAEELDKLTTLRTSKMREADARLRQYNYRYTLIRIRFPNNYVLQGVFSVHESFDNVREFVAERLTIMLGGFNLTDPTSDKRFDNEDQSFYDYGLAPAALLHFDWDNETISGLARTAQRPVYLHPDLEKRAELL